MKQTSLNLLLSLATLYTASTGCAMRQAEYRPISEQPALVAGIDGWMSGNMHKLAQRLGEESEVEVIVNSVHFWQNNMDRIREANRYDRPIILLGYSAGAHQALLTSQQCDREGIYIDKVILQDPFFTLYSDLRPEDFPKNVGKIVSYFSTDILDPMFWARGDYNKFQHASQDDSRYAAPQFVRGSHFSCFLWQNVGENLRKEIKETIESHVPVLKNK